ncbi:porin [Crenobacter cavernae]|nr:porin [Crenobacter cavernae]
MAYFGNVARVVPFYAFVAANGLIFLGWPIYASGKTVKQMEREVSLLAEKNRQQELRLNRLEQELMRLTAGGAQKSLIKAPAPVAVASVQPPVKNASRAQFIVAGESASSNPEANQVRQSVEDIYQEASGFFSGTKFSIEPGLTYTHYDTRELRLNGFLALDSIFLGSINLDRLKSDSYTFDLTTRLSPSPRWQFDLNVPFVARDTTYFSGGVGGASSRISQASVNQGPRLGDISFGVSYKLLKETADNPDMVVSLRARAPTGKEPYGIKLNTVPGNDNLSIPDELPTGSGIWSMSAGMSFVKTVDPAVLFASIGYTHNRKQHFDDISATRGVVQPGVIKLGNSWQFGAGFAFALSEKLSLGMSYSLQRASSARVKGDGGEFSVVTGSDANAATMNLGLTYAVSKKLSIVPNLATGLTPDAPDYSVSIKFPYAF